MTNLMMIATADEDCGIVSADVAAIEAQEMANALGTVVTVRDTITDELIATYEPVVVYHFNEGTNSAGEPAMGYAPEGRARRMSVVAARRAGRA